MALELCLYLRRNFLECRPPNPSRPPRRYRPRAVGLSRAPRAGLACECKRKGVAKEGAGSAGSRRESACTAGYEGDLQSQRTCFGASVLQLQSLDPVDPVAPFLVGDEERWLQWEPLALGELWLVQSDLHRDVPPANLETTYLPFSFCPRSGWL
ncbi:hypothetical protein B0H13DRAFT_2099511 [Mycena leptocephala]|nr:hypothetical protein B0H13DRAFT_2099511 [Mycena leptocephala]